MISAEEAIKRLKEGNAQYVSTDTFEADISSTLLEHFAKNGQKPYAIVIGCSDSRVTPERIFHAAMGDLILYQGNQITVYYDENTWSFTKLGHLNGTEDEIREAFGGKEDVTAEFSVEWTE